MKNPLTKISQFEEYTDAYKGDFFRHYQIHIFSVPQIISTYYDPRYIEIDQVKHIAENLFDKIRTRSNRNNEVTLFEKNNKFLISEHSKLIEPAEIMEFDAENLKFEFSEDNDDFFDFLGETKVDVFVRNALITVGAEDLYSEIEPFVNQHCKEQGRLNSYYAELRDLDKTNPLYKLEIYRIEKNYIPVKIDEKQCNSVESFNLLPEYRSIEKKDKRITILLKEISTGKIVEGDINEAIERIKYNKWFRKNPSVIDAGALFRMELDDDDPNFLSWDDYVSNDEENEEGDDEYTPH